LDARIPRSPRKIRSVNEERFTFRPPDLALGGLGVRELARRSIGIAVNSLGIAPAGAPAQVRAHPTSIPIRGRPVTAASLYIARITQRCSRRAPAKHCGGAPLQKYLWQSLWRLDTHAPAAELRVRMQTTIIA